MIGFALVCVLSLAGFQTGQEYFQKALSKERAEGNLQEAITLYQKAIEASRDEALSAKAQLRIGLCYEKLGLREAEKAFRLVVERYPNQNDAVSHAKERLDRLASISQTPVAISGGISLRKLDIPIGVPSPDGKYIAANENDSDLFLYEIESKRKNVIKVSSLETGFLQYGVSWSPDSRQFAYVWRSPQHFSELYIWQIGASEPRLVYGADRNIDLGNIAGWPPDMNWIYIQYRQRVDMMKTLGRISTKSGELTKICAIDKSQFNMRLSPDGKYLAFNTDATPQDHDIRIMTVDGRTQTVLFKHQGMENFLNWTPDGKYIIYTSRSISPRGLWLLSIENGHAFGAPIEVHLFGEYVEMVGATNVGAYYVKTALSGMDACTAQIDLKTGETVRPIQLIEPGTIGWTSTPFWSADGGSLAYFYQKKADLTTRFHFDTLKIKSMKTGIIKEYALDFLADSQSGPLPRWSSDGDSILVLGSKGDVNGLFKFDLDKKASTILSNDRDICAFSADGEIVYLDRMTRNSPSQRAQTLIRKNPSTGKETIIYSGGEGEGIGRISLSPDDSMIGFYSAQFSMEMEKGGIFVFSANPGKILSKQDARFFPGIIFFDWGPSGNGLLVRRLGVIENRSMLQTFYYPTIDPSIDPTLVQLSIRGAFAFHPDGKTVAFTQSTNRGEFWILENILPKK